MNNDIRYSGYIGDASNNLGILNTLEICASQVVNRGTYIFRLSIFNFSLNLSVRLKKHKSHPEYSSAHDLYSF